LPSKATGDGRVEALFPDVAASITADAVSIRQTLDAHITWGTRHKRELTQMGMNRRVMLAQ
jgi:hypothetical protein